MPVTWGASWLHPDEHPESMNYKPLASRSPLEQARWWALMAKRVDRQERALYTRGEEDRLPEVSFDLWRLLKEAGHG